MNKDSMNRAAVARSVALELAVLLLCFLIVLVWFVFLARALALSGGAQAVGGAMLGASVCSVLFPVWLKRHWRANLPAGHERIAAEVQWFRENNCFAVCQERNGSLVRVSALFFSHENALGLLEEMRGRGVRGLSICARSGAIPGESWERCGACE